MDKLSLKLKHLEFIQSSILRMSQNSFQMKNWTIVVLAALVALYADSQNLSYIIVSMIATVVFWGLDGYYLYQERRFRKLYDAVVSDIGNNVEQVGLFSMTLTSNHGFCGWAGACFSKTILPIYGPIVVALVTYLKVKFL